MQRGKVRHPFLVYLLMTLTCGIYGIYWFFVVCDEINRGLGRREFNAGLEFVLMIVTCGMWWFWWTWKASEAIVELQQTWGVEPKMDEGILFIASFFGFGGIVKQLSLNNAWENGAPTTGHIGHEQPGPAPHQTQQRQSHHHPSSSEW